MDGHTQDDGVEIQTEETDERGVRGLEVEAETVALIVREGELTGLGSEQALIEMVELLCAGVDGLAGRVRRLHITLGERLDILHDKGQETREITVLNRRHECAVLAEGTGEHHRELRILDDRRFAATGTRNGFMLGCLAKSGVVIRSRGAPDVGNDRAFGLMDVAAAVLTREGLVESRIGRVARDNKRSSLMDGFDEFEGEVGDTLSARRRTNDEELEGRVIALGGDAIAAVEVRHDSSASGQSSHEQHVFLGGRLRERENGLQERRQVSHIHVRHDVEVSLLLRG